MARWIQNIAANDPVVVGDTIIAGWWPFTFYRVMTWEVRAASATEGILALTRKLQEMDNPGTVRDYFITTVQKTDRDGFAKSEDPQFETTYSNKTAAHEGHARIVAAVADGKRSRADLVRCTHLE